MRGRRGWKRHRRQPERLRERGRAARGHLLALLRGDVPGGGGGHRRRRSARPALRLRARPRPEERGARVEGDDLRRGDRQRLLHRPRAAPEGEPPADRLQHGGVHAGRRARRRLHRRALQPAALRHDDHDPARRRALTFGARTRPSGRRSTNSRRRRRRSPRRRRRRRRRRTASSRPRPRPGRSSSPAGWSRRRERSPRRRLPRRGGARRGARGGRPRPLPAPAKADVEGGEDASLAERRAILLKEEATQYPLWAWIPLLDHGDVRRRCTRSSSRATSTRRWTTATNRTGGCTSCPSSSTAAACSSSRGGT